MELQTVLMEISPSILTAIILGAIANAKEKIKLLDEKVNQLAENIDIITLKLRDHILKEKGESTLTG